MILKLHTNVPVMNPKTLKNPYRNSYYTLSDKLNKFYKNVKKWIVYDYSDLEYIIYDIPNEEWVKVISQLKELELVFHETETLFSPFKMLFKENFIIDINSSKNEIKQTQL